LRKNHQEQFSLVESWLEHPHAKELEAISDVLDADPTMAALVAQDLVGPGADASKGRLGMSGDLVLRAAVVRQLNGFSYEELAFHLADSATYRRFCRLGLGDGDLKRSTLGSNIKRIRPETWEAIHRCILKLAVERGVEDGRKTRVDCTVVASPIHEPTDATLLFDVVRVLARLLGRARSLCTFPFCARVRRAKRRMLGVRNAKHAAARKGQYRDLLDATIETLEFVPAATAALSLSGAEHLLAAASLAADLKHYAGLGWRVADQTHRRVFEEEAVPAAEKVVSIFEEHTDVIVKDRRDVHYGHKVCLSTGASLLVLDCQVLDGNPADSTLVEDVLERHRDLFGRVPRQTAMDGGFASRANVQLAKSKGVKDVCFAKRRGIAVTDMVKSAWVFKRLRDFRAGVEGGISLLKRCFGLDRCRWRGLESFKAYTWAAVVSCNLLVLARHALT
jgi:transposase, IS5 family